MSVLGIVDKKEKTGGNSRVGGYVRPVCNPRVLRRFVTSCSRALFLRSSSWTVSSRVFRLLSSSISRSSLSMCSLVLARMARWASRSLARLRASCDGVRVDTLLVPVVGQHRAAPINSSPVPSHKSMAHLSASAISVPRLMVICSYCRLALVSPSSSSLVLDSRCPTYCAIGSVDWCDWLLRVRW